MTADVRFSPRAEHELEEILREGSDRYTLAQRLAYIDDIEQKCLSLQFMPERYQKVIVNRSVFRRMNYKAHAIFYRVAADGHQVIIEAILRSNRDFGRHLK